MTPPGRRNWANNNNDGVFGGGTVGYNYQTGAFVFGVEADFGGAGLTGNWNNGVVAGVDHSSGQRTTPTSMLT